MATAWSNYTRAIRFARLASAAAGIRHHVAAEWRTCAGQLMPFAADYYEQPMVADLLRVQALLYLSTPFISIPEAIMGRALVDCARNNNLSQMLSIFALGMIGVGFSATAAMSTVKLTSGIAMLLSILFLASAACALIQ